MQKKCFEKVKERSLDKKKIRKRDRNWGGRKRGREGKRRER